MNKNDYIVKINDFSKNLEIDLVKKLIAFDQIDSTNSKAKELALKNAKEGTIVISKIQKKGRGRFDRIWESPEGGLYFSIILKPKCRVNKTTLLPLIAALSVCKTIKSITDLNVNIKWPNDVLINDKKTCGILLESETKKNEIDFVILGIGLNLNTDMSSISKEIQSISTSIANEIGIMLNYFDFLEKLLTFFNKYYKMFVEKKYDFLINEWKNNSDTINKKVTIDTSDKKITGIAIDIDESGFLIIKTDTDEIKKITTGDCFYIN